MNLDLPDDLIVVSCHRCDKVLLSPKNLLPGWEHLPPLAGRVYGRAMCAWCLERARLEPAPAENVFGIVQTWE